MLVNLIFREVFVHRSGVRLNYVVPENIQTPTTEGIGNSRGVGGLETQEIPEGRGVGQSNHFPGGQYHFVFDLSSNIASYRPCRSFLGHR